MNEMRGKKTSQEELEKEEWIYVLTFGYSLKLFKKKKKYILWDSKSQKITHEWLEEKK